MGLLNCEHRIYGASPKQLSELTGSTLAPQNSGFQEVCCGENLVACLGNDSGDQGLKLEFESRGCLFWDCDHGIFIKFPAIYNSETSLMTKNMYRYKIESGNTTTFTDTFTNYHFTPKETQKMTSLVSY
jgi:hypothetical protein